jgi:hypothetical protein
MRYARTAALGLIAMLAGSTIGGHARAQGTAAVEPTDARLSEAKELFQEGVKLLDEKKWAEAAGELERSLAIRESVSVLYDLGLAYRGLGEVKKAEEHLQRCVDLARKLGSPDAAVDRAVALLDEVRGLLGHIIIKARGGAERVSMDGVAVGAADGAYDLMVEPGRHTLVAERAGYERSEQVITVASGDKRIIMLNAGERPSLGRIVVDTGEVDAEVFLDGLPKGHVKTIDAVGPGPHVVSAEAGDHLAQETTIVVVSGKDVVAKLTLEESSSIVGSWWLWTVIGVAIAGAAVGVAVAASSGTKPPNGGTYNVVLRALSAD